MKLLSRLIFFLLFAAVLGLVIAYARGYRFDFQNRSLTSTGIIAVTSYPRTAKIYINNDLKGVTDTNLTLSPGIYQIDIKKEGFTSWSKKVTLKGELVVNIDVILFPINPSLSPLTNLGIIKAVPLDDSDKVIVFSEAGVSLFEAAKRPLSFFPPLKPIAKKELFPEDFDFTDIEVSVSPDLKQAIVGNYLLSLEEENQSILDLSNSSTSKETLINAWEEQKKANFMKILETYPTEFTKIASDSFKIIAFSPSETKILYQANLDTSLPPIITPPLISSNQSQETREIKKNNYYVYDKKEDKNYKIESNKTQWYFNSKHLVIEENKKISIVDYDNGNKQTVYSGPFKADFFTTTSDGRIIILANLNPEANKYPDLYLVSIR